MALTTQQIAQQSQVNVVDSASTGFNGLTSDDFLKLLITQLQNQDPSNPMDSDQLLQQVSEMRALQSNIELSDSLKSLTLSQQLTSAASFLGKQVAGTDANQQSVSGTVGQVVVAGGKTMLSIGNSQIELGNVTNVAD
jgi:flagellar basal-body rod modification protein FlgD